jgi:chemotaxis protein MotA
MADYETIPTAELPVQTAAPKPGKKSAKNPSKKRDGSQVKMSPDFATILGMLVATGAIVGGLAFEGGSIKDIIQVSAAVIVLGGTFGAVLVTTPLAILRDAFKRLPSAFVESETSLEDVVGDILGLATRARKSGLVSLEPEIARLKEPFLKKAIALAVDGITLQDIQKIMELEMLVDEHKGEAEAKVFESAGGYSPTIGIIGAVLGLIQVMKHLDNISEVGRGIAVAFVATVYGVAAANLFFLPIANKLKARTAATFKLREMILEGVTSVVSGLNPRIIRSKLEVYVPSLGRAPAAGSEQGTSEPTTAIA